ncbi:MAG: anthranilate phosphoribosyltransferase [endosymbiont of Galathealinum brachiosum]|uniref:Anthranilate phosphoribosyltransferase n=1 Tax=endosymbiont of Galathealinum brachiosum TaxID=2200906 RepID=A0A370DDU3_9GAMM|nr:MAG: anthranilate phosphoribosyltransferase [endosymbiont of Galathealinum brachiosum]
MDMQSAIKAVTEKQNLSRDEMTQVMNLIMTGQATDSQIGGFLIGLRMKGESIDEVTAAASVMRELSTKVEVPDEYLVDTCGTGGDSSGSFNISTASVFVTAAAGAHVAKHGNRSVSSKSGSADVLETAGVNLDITPEQVSECIKNIGAGFLFAIKHHGAMKHAIGPRKEMAVRTIFNVLGPLTNPASAPNQVIGVFSKDWVEPLAQVLKQLGSHHVMIVHADDGMDEISIASATSVAELKDGEITTYSIKPEDFSMQRAELTSIKARDSEDSLTIIKSVFENQEGPAKDIVCLNAGAAIYVSGLAGSLAEGIEKAQAAVAEGKAKEKFEALISYSNNF